MVRTKVFVGNLSFQTQETELATEFGKAGKVISANIITRGPRSLGYGFVEMDSEEDAEKAVQLMNKKEINGRQINVEVARPQDETKKTRAQGEEGAPQKKPRKPRVLKSETGVEGETRPKPTRKPKAPRTDNGAEGETDDSKRPKGRKPAPKRSNEPREESKTTLFVANLPFGLNDEAFAKILTDKQLKLKTAHVVSKKNGKSKGYGFVEFDTQEDQQKALAALHKQTVDGRELSVKVALTELKNELNEEEKAEKVPAEKKTVPEKKSSPAPQKANEKKSVPAEKKANAEKKTAVPEKKTETAEKKTPVPEKKTTPVAEKKTATPEKKEEKK